ncbi:hypothetical protein B0H14DRAFT_3468153 [Mycena olivaceomarginata]|nr:hypothetical protein B0H14DRAFT_3468153 [Mycena olivaceomarginata]
MPALFVLCFAYTDGDTHAPQQFIYFSHRTPCCFPAALGGVVLLQLFSSRKFVLAFCRSVCSPRMETSLPDSVPAERCHIVSLFDLILYDFSSGSTSSSHGPSTIRVLFRSVLSSPSGAFGLDRHGLSLRRYLFLQNGSRPHNSFLSFFGIFTGRTAPAALNAEYIVVAYSCVLTARFIVSGMVFARA